MLSAVIPVLNAGPGLRYAIASIYGAVDEVVVVDGGSADSSPDLARSEGARVVSSGAGRGAQLARGASETTGDWLLFIHADTRLSANWRRVAERFIGGDGTAAGYFSLAFDDRSRAAARTARIANWRARRLGLPYGDQGLLIARSLYDAVGGFRPLPLMEDVDLARRLGRRRLTPLPATATTSAARYRAEGWTRRSARNLGCLALYYFGVTPGRIARLYG